MISCFSEYGLVQWIFKGIYFTSGDVGAHGIFLVCVHLIFWEASKFSQCFVLSFFYEVTS